MCECGPVCKMQLDSGQVTKTMSSKLSNKRARPDSVVHSDFEDQHCAPHTPLLPTSSEQSHHESLLQLNTDTAPAKSVRLVKDRLPFQELLRTWENERDNLTICSVRLVGDSRQPLLYTGISAETLAAHSAWGAGRLKYEHSSHGIVPVRTSASTVEKIVRALYSGSIEVGEDVEETLVLANALQIKLVETACVNYLLDLTLPAQQLGQVLLLFHTLSLKAPIQQLVLRYVQQPWTEEIMAVLQVLFGHLNRHNIFQERLLAELCRDTTGKLCELQVLDMLLSAGFDQSDHRLALLFQVGRVTPIAMQQFSQAATFDNFHKNLTIAACNRGKREASSNFEMVTIQMLSAGESCEHIIHAPEELKGSFKRQSVRQLITYVVHDSFPLIEILDIINFAPQNAAVRFPQDSRTYSVLQKNATCHINGFLEPQTCFGVKLIKR